MGNQCCKPDQEDADSTGRRLWQGKRPRWKSDDPLTEEQLQRMRDEFWDTEPHYGGSREIWEALKAACETDVQTAKLIIESAGIIVATEDMRICYDERGAKYELPKYVLSCPTNMIRSNSKSSSGNDSGRRTEGIRNSRVEVEMLAATSGPPRGMEAMAR